MARIAAISALKRRLLSITHPPPPGIFFTVRSLQNSTNNSGNTTADYDHITAVRLDSRYNKYSTYGDWSSTKLASLFAGRDYHHWFIHIYKPGGEGATKEEMIDCYVKTLAKVLGSEEKAKEKIYKVVCDTRAITGLGFGCDVGWEIAAELDELPEVGYTYAELYADADNKDYGGELLVNGEIVQRSPSGERRDRGGEGS